MASVFTDISGNGRNLLISDTSDYPAGSVALPNGEVSRTGDGAIITPAQAIVGTAFDLWGGGDWTIGMWVHLTAHTVSEIILSYSNGPADRCWIIQHDPTELLMLYCFNTAGGTYVYRAINTTSIGSPVMAGRWALVHFVKEAAVPVPTIYVDGGGPFSTFNQNANGSPKTGNSGSTLAFGSYLDGNSPLLSATSKIGEITIFNRILTPYEMAEQRLAMLIGGV